MKNLKVISILIVCLLTLGVVSCDIGGEGGGGGPTTSTPKYTVTFNANGGSGTVPSPQTVNAGSSVNIPGGNSLRKTDYTFGGWNTNSTGTEINYPAGTSITPTGNITLYAKWDAAVVSNFTISFNTNGGTGAAPASQTVKSGSSVTLPSGNALSKDGFNFGGWNTNAAGTEINYNAGSSFTPAGNITLYAKWNSPDDSNVPITHTVTFNTNGGNGTTPGALTVNNGSSVTLSNGNGLSKNGFTFGGWNTKADGTGTNLAGGASITPTGSITLYAKWDAVVVSSHTVTFNANGGTGTAPSPLTVNDGSSVTLPPQGNLAKNGSTFGGWNTKADGSGINFSAGTFITPTGNITLYAQWDATPITSVSIVVTAPVLGATPDLTVSGTGNFVANAVSWSPSPDRFLGSQAYTASVTLTANSGYTFTGLNSATINGQNASVSVNIGTAVTLSFAFPATEAAAVPEPALRAVPVAASTPSPRSDSYTDGTKNIYLIDVGYIENTYISTVAVANYNDFTPISTSKTTVTRETVKEAMKETVTNSITVTDTQNKKASIEGSWKEKFPSLGEFGVSIKYEWNESKTNTNTSTRVLETNFEKTETVVSTLSNSFTIGDKGEPPGYYRYAIYATSDVYFVVTTSLDNQQLLSWDTVVCARDTTYLPHMDFSPDGNFDNSPVKNDMTFAEDFYKTLTKPVKDSSISVTNTAEWNNALSTIRNGGSGTEKEPKTYNISVSGTVSVSGVSTNTCFGTVEHVRVSLKGNGKLSLTSNGHILKIGKNQTLIIDDNLTLQGRNDPYNKSVLFIEEEGTLELKNGTITGNTSIVFGGGVSVGGTFNMSGGTITGNTANYGGGVYVEAGGIFNMSGGTISGNTTKTKGEGGGVYVGSNGKSTFNMSGGTISGNTASSQGGGVFIGKGVFSKTGGTINGSDGSQPNAVKYSDGTLVKAAGHAVRAIYNNTTKSKNTTAGPTVILSFNGTDSPPSFSGGWD